MNVRYQKAQRAAYTVLERARVRALPINLESIINQIPKLGIVTYSKLRALMPDVDEFIASDEGGLLRKKANGIVNTLIAYNDDQIPTRQRWTIAHELGHYILNHPNTHDDSYEIEAHIFAQHLLMPAPLLYDILEACDVSTYYHASIVAKVCNVSDDASKRLIKYFNRINAKHYRPSNAILSKKFEKNIDIHIRTTCAYIPKKVTLDKYTQAYLVAEDHS